MPKRYLYAGMRSLAEKVDSCSWSKHFGRESLSIYRHVMELMNDRCRILHNESLSGCKLDNEWEGPQQCEGFSDVRTPLSEVQILGEPSINF